MKTKIQLLKEFEKLETPKIETKNNINCNFCYSCNFCNSCLRLYNGILCKELRFNRFSENAFNKNKYWVLNKEVSKEEFEKVKEIMEKK